jgi:hypothetical protein
MAKVQISWQRFKWPVGCNWKSFQQQLEQAKVTEKELARSVYVIRGNGLFTISYMKGSSPTLYIGEGNFKQRIAQHKKWFEPLIKLVGGEFPLSIYVSTPRVRNNKIIYRDMEAALIEEIISIYGCLPFRNKQKETRLFDCQYEKATGIFGLSSLYHQTAFTMNIIGNSTNKIIKIIKRCHLR